MREATIAGADHLLIHCEDDQIVPINDSSKKSAKLIKGAKEIYTTSAINVLSCHYVTMRKTSFKPSPNC